MSKVFVSFDYENDKHYKFLLEAWHANPEFEFVFEDGTPREINSSNVGRVKAALTSKIKGATYTLVIVGKHSNDPHRDRQLIGYRNWINFEVAKSIEEGNRLAVVKIDKEYTSPTELLGAKAAWAYSFTQANVLKALREAPLPTQKLYARY